MLDRVYGSPARSYCGDHSSATESEGEDTLELLTEVPNTPDQTVMDGWLKFRDNKRVSRGSNITSIRGYRDKKCFWPKFDKIYLQTSITNNMLDIK